MCSIPRGIVSFAIVAIIAIVAEAQVPDLSGTWKLNEGASKADPAVTFAGLGGHSVIPVTLYVTHAKNGTVIIGSNMNTSHARTYKPGGESLAPLGSGEVTTVSRWDGGTLVAEGQDASAKLGLRETLTLSADGNSLVVAITLTTATEEHTSRLVYTKSSSEPPCEDWPTPCKSW